MLVHCITASEAVKRKTGVTVFRFFYPLFFPVLLFSYLIHSYFSISISISILVFLFRLLDTFNVFIVSVIIREPLGFAVRLRAVLLRAAYLSLVILYPFF